MRTAQERIKALNAPVLQEGGFPIADYEDTTAHALTVYWKLMQISLDQACDPQARELLWRTYERVARRTVIAAHLVDTYLADTKK